MTRSVLKMVICSFVLSAVCFAQATRVPTVTRTVQQFGDLERKLAEANDSHARSALLTDDFEERLCSEPGIPIAREDWLKQPIASAHFSQPAVHIYADIAVFSAILKQNGQPQMIVDTWKKAGNDWKLAVRYRCPSSGERPPTEAIPKRY